jgi:hypothetical protein
MTYRLEDNELTKEQALWFVEATGLLCAAATADWGSTKEVKALRAFINKQTVNATFGKGAWGATQLTSPADGLCTRGPRVMSSSRSTTCATAWRLPASGRWTLTTTTSAMLRTCGLLTRSTALMRRSTSSSQKAKGKGLVSNMDAKPFPFATPYF